ncbi:MAG: precorrin-8X methylmutase [Nitrospirota bacterium]
MSEAKRTGILIIGHGSRRQEANEILFKIKSLLKKRIRVDEIEAAFFSLSEPDIPTAIGSLVKKGCLHIIAQPFFLFRGNHMRLDMPEVLKECEKRHEGVKVDLMEPLGGDMRIVEILEEKIIEAVSPLIHVNCLPPPDEIEKTSMEIIERRLVHYNIEKEHIDLVKRVVHATADFSFVHSLRFHPEAVSIARELLSSDSPIIVDVNMVMAGIIKKDKRRILCSIEDDEVKKTAKMNGLTRAEAAMERLSREMNRGIVVIGNAPTALRRVIDLVNRGDAYPGLIIGVPVGFVGASESKIELLKTDIPYITNIGPRGGTPVACSIINALILINS